eukprot:scaffold406670_cov20-Prasinocladus_malaysianus.AAC.1
MRTVGPELSEAAMAAASLLEVLGMPGAGAPAAAAAAAAAAAMGFFAAAKAAGGAKQETLI